MDFAEQNFLDDLSSGSLHAPPPETGPARVLLALPPGETRNNWADQLRSGGNLPTVMDRLEPARRALSADEYDVVLIHKDFDDGLGMKLARHIQRCRLGTKMILVTEDASFDVAVDALRIGIVDVVQTSVVPDALRYSIECAVMKAREERRQAERVARLRDICRKLNSTKQETSRQIEVLCQDLANAYEDIADQMSEVAMSSEFKTLLAQELDLESLLRTTLEYLLTKTGPTNAAVFLPDPEGHYSLGAYVNYDCPRETAEVLLDHLCQSVCPHMATEDEFVIFDDADDLAEWLGEEAAFLKDSQMIAFNCTDGSECLAVMVLFRDQSNPFEDALAGVLEALRPIFARQVSSVIRVHHRAGPQWPSEAADEGWDDYGEYGDGYGFAA